jgi:hypothetical protein
MADFKIQGPFEVPFLQNPGGRCIDEKRLTQFWENNGCQDQVGCYVFGISHSRGTLPYYTGRTISSFKNECFQPHKLKKYHNALTRSRRGKPIMFFAILDRRSGPKNKKAIQILEERLIGLGIRRNPDLANISNTREDDISLPGVMGSPQGRPSSSTSSFRRMMGLKKT